jgi:hypothetical protein
VKSGGFMGFLSEKRIYIFVGVTGIARMVKNASDNSI